MEKKLYIIGNGFDLAHCLPTNFDPNFKEIAEANESITSFWDLYQTEEYDIWSSFERLLSMPDFNSLEEIFFGFAPNYLSDYERDRDAIITQVDISGELRKSLTEFAQQADHVLKHRNPLRKFENFFSEGDIFVTFNYTHTLEQLYGIESKNILHIHGENGRGELLLGYPKGSFSPEKYGYDATMKGRHFVETDIESYIDSIEDYYERTAYQSLYDKVKSFSKSDQSSQLSDFISDINFSKIIVIGHSYGVVDSQYFGFLVQKLPEVEWLMYYYDSNDEDRAKDLIKKLNIKNFYLKKNDF